MADRLVSINTADPAGSQFPGPVAVEVQQVAWDGDQPAVKIAAAIEAADIPTQVVDAISADGVVTAAAATAVTAEVAGRDLVERSDPGIANAAEVTSASYKQVWLGPNGELFRGDRIDGSTEISYARLTIADIATLTMGGGTTQSLDVAGLVWVPYTDADGHTPEICLDQALQLPQWACERIVARGGGGGVSATAPIDLVIVAGQSNATQRVTLPATVEPAAADVLTWNGTSFSAASGAPWLGSGFSRRYQELHGRPEGRRVAIVPAAVGSTGFSSLSPGTWDRTVTTGADRYLYPEMIAKAQSALAAAPAGSRIIAVLWSQGEQDRSIAATTYQAKLDDLITQTRIDLNISDLPWLISSVSPDWLYTLAAASDARGAAIDAILEDTPRRVPRTSFNRGPAGMGEAAGGGIHWNPMGQSQRGKAMAGSGYDQALLNVNTAGTTNDSWALPPQNIHVERSGTVATVLWDSPPARSQSFDLATCVDGVGTTWTTQTLTGPVVHKHVMTLASAATPLWIRMSSTNELETSDTVEVHF